MSSQKKIEVHQSSFLSLKSELLKKKQEVRDAKLSEYPNKPTPVKKVKTKLDKANEGVDERNTKDLEEYEKEINVLEKSKQALEAKSKLYDEFSKHPESAASVGNVLVDFGHKEREKKEEGEATGSEQGNENPPEKFTYKKEDWVDFVDCLGRTKRCHKDDIEAMKVRDEKLKMSLFGKSADKEKKGDGSGSGSGCAPREMPEQPDLFSEDMRRKMLREKWEEEEKQLAERKNIHYQHVLFDEARTHGVGYYHFSTDETERKRQMKGLNDLRKKTLEQQALIKMALKRRQKQMEQRIGIAKKRKSERLCLPLPLAQGTENLEESDGEEHEPEELKREEKTSSSVRPWDLGKRRSSTRTYTQDEWIEKRRAERRKEFAPMHSSESSKTAKKKKREEEPLPEPYYEDISSSPKDLQFDEPNTFENERETGADGASAPASMDPNGPPPETSEPFVLTPEVERSIEEGLNYIRKQVEEKKRRERGERDRERRSHSGSH